MRTKLEQQIVAFDNVMRKFFFEFQNKKKPKEYSEAQYRESCGQMRINHTGEVCAQALYAGHVNSKDDPNIKDWLKHAAEEEHRHLEWCAQRLEELGARPSALNPFFYAASYVMAKALSSISPKLNLAFIRETERQVQEHLNAQLPHLTHDPVSCAIISKMIEDEAKHHDQAAAFGGERLPLFSERLMHFAATCMKKIVYYC